MEMTLVRDPIYQQLHRALRELIRAREFGTGDKFLTEREVSDRFRVSRTTANKALSSLVAEGVLAFRKGVGTFVKGDVLAYDMRSLVSYTDKARAAGKVPSTRVLAFERKAAARIPAKVSEALGVPDDGEVYYMERLRLADGTAVILERRHVVARFCPGLKAADVSGSLYAVWAERYKLDIAGADQTIRAVPIRGHDAKRLKVRRGAAGLLAISVGCLAGDEPLWYEETLYRGDAYEFHNRLGAIQPAGPAAGVLRSV